ncbi:NUDIX domain-containing protein [Bradyrhizobium sp. ISRA443]|uniref:NUDIX domain-containing protein n=1 Tax=unclassified Bradyrhizobium TaxID=2631580 RepID=UPI00247ACA39|nr:MULTISPECIES: NUDIX domain-containing protein [unclassified Bradyrhizobium]WGR95798.1 NUDIX domain-containing protein [Bradyrhizobium sp. ISRA435]WGS00921.1 NUDIX domain-containing protein [Bradyrhizobium sp. ISRA436]WGS07808.1 NUDIX domain-containing protein [Bradyrhizobium sp. ISRA437]WGS14696.1 NUDIX domain-containing protein [Bradyrhizobium sp. ISRA443]
MAKRSAGLLMFRYRGSSPEVLLVHPGGPFWAKKDDGAWSIPKGLYEDGEDPFVAAKREFEEETGQSPVGSFIELGVFKQPGGKQVSAWAFEGEFDLASFKSNNFEMEWPPRSGRLAEFPEADRANWFPVKDALRKVTKGQFAILRGLLDRLGLSEDDLA